MDQTRIDEIVTLLANDFKKYVLAIINIYGKYIPKSRLEELKSINDYHQYVKIFETGSVNGYANNEGVYLPISADRLLTSARKIPGFGMNKNHKSYNANNLLTNNNTFLSYLFHVYISGSDAKQYYDELLLHETMHFCGSGGAYPLKEGINELLTRKLALENNFITNGCAYPKELKIALKLQSILGEEIINQIAFINDDLKTIEYIKKNKGLEIAILYNKINEEMEKEFSKKYYAKMNTYKGSLGPIRKTINYRKINYQKVDLLITELESKLKEVENNKIKTM